MSVKVYERVVKEESDKKAWQFNQFDFMPGRGHMTFAIIILQQVQEKILEDYNALVQYLS